MKRFLCVLFVCLLTLGITAYTVGMSIHRQHQAELRENFGVEETGVPAYVEYEVPEKNTHGVILLSAVNDGSNQSVFLNVSPITRDDLALTQHPVQFTLDGGMT